MLDSKTYLKQLSATYLLKTIDEFHVLLRLSMSELFTWQADRQTLGWTDGRTDTVFNVLVWSRLRGVNQVRTHGGHNAVLSGSVVHLALGTLHAVSNLETESFVITIKDMECT